MIIQRYKELDERVQMALLKRCPRTAALTKWVGRNWVAITAITAIVLAIVCGWGIIRIATYLLNNH
jgi:hypothetical protein